MEFKIILKTIENKEELTELEIQTNALAVAYLKSFCLLKEQYEKHLSEVEKRGKISGVK